MEYFKLDIQPILDRVEERGDVQHIRHYVRCATLASDCCKLPVRGPAISTRAVLDDLKVHLWHGGLANDATVSKSVMGSSHTKRRRSRFSCRDFDPFSLRINLPDAVRKVHSAYEAGRGKVYIHCTAGELSEAQL